MDKTLKLKNGNKFTKRLEIAKVQAEAALIMTIKERLQKWSFLARWPNRIRTPPPSDSDYTSDNSDFNYYSNKNKMKRRSKKLVKKRNCKKGGNKNDSKVFKYLTKEKNTKRKNKEGKSNEDIKNKMYNIISLLCDSDSSDNEDGKSEKNKKQKKNDKNLNSSDNTNENNSLNNKEQTLKYNDENNTRKSEKNSQTLVSLEENKSASVSDTLLEIRQISKNVNNFSDFDTSSLYLTNNGVQENNIVIELEKIVSENQSELKKHNKIDEDNYNTSQEIEDPIKIDCTKRIIISSDSENEIIKKNNQVQVNKKIKKNNKLLKKRRYSLNDINNEESTKNLNDKTNMKGKKSESLNIDIRSNNNELNTIINEQQQIKIRNEISNDDKTLVNQNTQLINTQKESDDNENMKNIGNEKNISGNKNITINSDGNETDDDSFTQPIKVLKRKQIISSDDSNKENKIYNAKKTQIKLIKKKNKDIELPKKKINIHENNINKINSEPITKKLSSNSDSENTKINTEPNKSTTSLQPQLSQNLKKSKSLGLRLFKTKPITSTANVKYTKSESPIEEYNSPDSFYSIGSSSHIHSTDSEAFKETESYGSVISEKHSSEELKDIKNTQTVESLHTLLESFTGVDLPLNDNLVSQDQVLDNIQIVPNSVDNIDDIINFISEGETVSFNISNNDD